LRRTDIEIQAGSLVQLYEVMSALTEQLKGVISRLARVNAMPFAQANFEAQ
jgi:hypothetical protein